ncbi:MAG: hypothetical protein H6737_24460 [Alphaproteobacteria bacterium]|nr:hypothetical protein [Alphaproteobacteria bacterium]
MWADGLTEAGDPDGERIQLSYQLATDPSGPVAAAVQEHLQRRADALFGGEALIVGPDTVELVDDPLRRRSIVRMELRMGYVRDVELAGADVRWLVERLARVSPAMLAFVERLSIEAWGPDDAERQDAWTTLAGLGLPARHLVVRSDDQLPVLTVAAGLPHLQTADIQLSELDEEAMPWMATTLPRLRELRLSLAAWQVDYEPARVLEPVAECWLPALETLRIELPRHEPDPPEALLRRLAKLPRLRFEVTGLSTPLKS